MGAVGADAPIKIVLAKKYAVNVFCMNLYSAWHVDSAPMMLTHLPPPLIIVYTERLQCVVTRELDTVAVSFICVASRYKTITYHCICLSLLPPEINCH